MSSPPEFDVAVVGASVAGCTAARLFAQRGASVALIERRHDPAAYKVVCTHAILLGWEGPDAGLGSRVAPLRDRLPPDLRDTPGPVFDALPFSSLYLLDDEFAAETANRTVHGAIHFGWSRTERAATTARWPSS